MRKLNPHKRFSRYFAKRLKELGWEGYSTAYYPEWLYKAIKEEWDTWIFIKREMRIREFLEED